MFCSWFVPVIFRFWLSHNVHYGKLAEDSIHFDGAGRFLSFAYAARRDFDYLLRLYMFSVLLLYVLNSAGFW